VWGRFAPAKASPRDVDLLLIVTEDFEMQNAPSAAQAVFNSVQAGLLYESQLAASRLNRVQKL
jgi:hypothetical protein